MTVPQPFEFFQRDRTGTVYVFDIRLQGAAETVFFDI